MLSPINYLKFPNRPYCLQKREEAKKAEISYNKDFISIYNTKGANLLSFGSTMSIDPRNILSISNNPAWFKLPKITLEDGTKHQFRPDETQKQSAKYLLMEDNTLFIAPTGTGKTALAHFAITKNMKQNKKTIVTVPQIALANDKFQEFKKVYGSENVGILTGDRSVNRDAPIVIMTTEILYNQAQELPREKDEIGTIVFDEGHYLGSEQRGTIWENSIMAAVQSGIQTLFLSATIGNPATVSDWLQSLNYDKHASKVVQDPSERYVPLVYKIYRPNEQEKFVPVVMCSINPSEFTLEELSERQKRALRKIYRSQNDKNQFYTPSDEEYSSVLSEFQEKMEDGYDTLEDFQRDFGKKYGFDESQSEQIANLLANGTKSVKHIYEPLIRDNTYNRLIYDLKNANMLPALIFRLSRDDCDNIVSKMFEAGIDLSNEDEKEQIAQIIEKYKNSGYLGNTLDEEMLLAGYASHHAGKLPQYRKMVEELFSKKLLKVVAATSTLSVGINMPAKTVVLSKLTYKKYDTETKKMESKSIGVNEFHQMAGRAGRRGIDDLGYVVLYNLKTTPKGKKEQMSSESTDELELAYQYIDSPPDSLRSFYKPDPVLLADYYSKNMDNSELQKIINKSFRVYKAPNRDKISYTLMRKFENYAQVLTKQGYLYKNYKNEYYLTPKGAILAHAQGNNPLMLTSLIYDEILKGGTPEQLCQIAGYIAGCDEQEEPAEMEDLAKEKLEELLEGEADKFKQTEQFFRLRNAYKSREDKILKSLKESKIPPDDILISDNACGIISYIWAHLNSTNEDTIENFEKITSSSFDVPKNAGSEEEKLAIRRIKTFNHKLKEGNVYRTLTHSVSVLKQIVRVCEYALDNPDNFPDVDYYLDLMIAAQDAIKLMLHDPIDMESAV